MDRRQAVHPRVELERNAERIARAEGTALIGDLDPFRRQTLLVEICFGALQVIFIEHLEAELVRDACVALFQHDAMVTALLERAQVDARLVLCGHL